MHEEAHGLSATLGDENAEFPRGSRRAGLAIPRSRSSECIALERPVAHPLPKRFTCRDSLLPEFKRRQKTIRTTARIDRFRVGVPPPPATVEVTSPKLLAVGLDALGGENSEWLVIL